MRALRCIAPHNVQIVDIPEPKIGADELLVEPLASGICGTDLEIIEGGVDPAYIRYPITLGHEWVGRVVSPGNGVSSPKVGSKIVVEGIIPCEKCVECLKGATNRCAIYDEIGFTRDGAGAQRIAVPAHLHHVLNEKVSLESAALVEPAAVVYQGLLRLDPVQGANILVVGDGTIGLLAAKLLQKFLPANVDMFGLRQSQNQLAMQAGASKFITNKDELTKNYDYVVEAAGAIVAVELAISQAKRGGKILLLGYPEQGARLQLGVHDLINNDITLHASFSYTRRSWKSVVDQLNSGELDLTFIVTHRFPLEEWESALKILKTGTSEARGKVLLTLNGD